MSKAIYYSNLLGRSWSNALSFDQFDHTPLPPGSVCSVPSSAVSRSYPVDLPGS